MKYIVSICIVFISSSLILISCNQGKKEEESKSNDAINPPEVKNKDSISSVNQVAAREPVMEKVNLSPDTLIGRWLRPDGNYIIQINTIHEDKNIEAQYFNPRPIHIERAELIPAEDIRLFIEFNDRGYEGSSYDLTYDLSNDALVGKYYQATYGQTYQIAFIRLQE